MKALIDQLIIGTHENIRTTYIGLQKSKHQLFFLQLDLLVFLLRAGSQAFLLPFSMPLPLLSSLVPPPLLVVLWIHLLMPGARRPYGEIGGSESTGSAAPV